MLGSVMHSQEPTFSIFMQPFNKSEQEDIGVAIKEAAHVIQSVLSVGIEKALSGVRIR